jgi:DNA-binding NarL/FixJ family response regulator
MLATSLGDVRHHFGVAATAHQRRRTPFEQARTQLCEGEMLRRFRRPRVARPALRAALATFRSLGAKPWAERAETELAAAGDRHPGRPTPAGLALLTPQELQVAQAAARGLNNPEVAASLFVSRKTVEAHLTRVYRKLGVRSRTDLTRLMLAPDTGNSL